LTEKCVKEKEKDMFPKSQLFYKYWHFLNGTLELSLFQRKSRFEAVENVSPWQ
jgi:hypothetical protein